MVKRYTIGDQDRISEVLGDHQDDGKTTLERQQPFGSRHRTTERTRVDLYQGVCS